MAKLILFVTSQIERGHEIGEAWEAAGVSGVTYVESFGLHGLRKAGHTMAVLPGMSSILEILRSNDQHNISMFTVVPDVEMANNVIRHTERLVGSLDQFDNGVLFVLDVERALGLHRIYPTEK